MQFPRSTLESLNKEYFSRISLTSWLFIKWLGAPVVLARKQKKGQNLFFDDLRKQPKVDLWNCILSKVLLKTRKLGN